MPPGLWINPRGIGASLSALRSSSSYDYAGFSADVVLITLRFAAAVTAAASAAAAAVSPPPPEVQSAMSQLPSESELSWLGLNRRLGLSDGAALFNQIEAVS
jgi:hypothetical protein